MVLTAARAWKEGGLEDFRRHVLVFGLKKGAQDNLPTLLIRMTPWTEDEVAMLRTWHLGDVTLLEDPFRPEVSMLSDAFYEGDLPREVRERMPTGLSRPPTTAPISISCARNGGASTGRNRGTSWTTAPPPCSPPSTWSAHRKQGSMWSASSPPTWSTCSSLAGPRWCLPWSLSSCRSSLPAPAAPTGRASSTAWAISPAWGPGSSSSNWCSSRSS